MLIPNYAVPVKHTENEGHLTKTRYNIHILCNYAMTYYKPTGHTGQDSGMYNYVTN